MPKHVQRFTIDLLPGEYNKTCTNRKIADTLKTELVVQIPKENDNPHDIKSYIPTTSCAENILERMINTRLITEREEKNEGKSRFICLQAWDVHG